MSDSDFASRVAIGAVWMTHIAYQLAFTSGIVLLKRPHLKFPSKQKREIIDSKERVIPTLSFGCISIALIYKVDLVFQFIKSFKLAHSYGSIAMVQRIYV
jgi:hypothetical protein